MGWKIAVWGWLLGMGVAASAQTGTDPATGIVWTLVSLDGKVVGEGAGASPPRLTAQCWKDEKGKLRFELLADAGDVSEVRFVPPFEKTQERPNAPILPKIQVTMEFLGYMKVKPVKRQWIGIEGLPGEWKYATPGFHSANMEEVMFYLQYLKALPTLRLTLPSAGEPAKQVVVEFATTDWQAKLRAEPMCWASSL